MSAVSFPCALWTARQALHQRSCMPLPPSSLHCKASKGLAGGCEWLPHVLQAGFPCGGGTRVIPPNTKICIPARLPPASRNRCIGLRYTVKKADVKRQCVSLAKHLGLTDGQLEYLNPQLVSKRTGKCRVQAGRKVCRGEAFEADMRPGLHF